MTINLTPFCGTDEARPYLMAPFSFGEFTYSTDGRIMVRVPRLDDVPEQVREGKWNDPLAALEGAVFTKIAFELPKAPDADNCERCEGTGKGHPDCPGCECECADCDGSGKDIPEWKVSTELAGIAFSLRYMRKVLALPDVEFSAPKAKAALLFRFDGGVGAIMPLSHPYSDSDHIKIFKEERNG